MFLSNFAKNTSVSILKVSISSDFNRLLTEAYQSDIVTLRKQLLGILVSMSWRMDNEETLESPSNNRRLHEADVARPCIESPTSTVMGPLQCDFYGI